MCSVSINVYHSMIFGTVNGMNGMINSESMWVYKKGSGKVYRQELPAAKGVTSGCG